MATTITRESDIKAARSVAHERHKPRPVRTAQEEYLRLCTLKELADMTGKIELRFSNREIEAMEER